jgi:hypothetical protein
VHSKPIDELWRCALAAALLVGLAPGQLAFATSASRAQSSKAAVHHCKCGMECHGRLCCCGPGSGEARPGPQEPTARSARTFASPCLSSAPCGDSAIPDAAPGSPVKARVVLATPSQATHNIKGQLVPFDHFCILPLELASRLERPPDRSRLA